MLARGWSQMPCGKGSCGPRVNYCLSRTVFGVELLGVKWTINLSVHLSSLHYIVVATVITKLLS